MNLQDAVLTSGTLATLTGINEYDRLEKVQNDFLLFVAGKLPIARHVTKVDYKEWNHAWNDFWRLIKIYYPGRY